MRYADSEHNAIFSTLRICKETLQLSVKGFDSVRWYISIPQLSQQTKSAVIKICEIIDYTWYIFCHNNERLPMIGVCGSESALESE